MKFMIYTHDKAGAADLRQATRPAHLDYVRKQDDVKVLSAGPWLDETETTPIGSLLVVEAKCIDCVKSWLEQDPYVKVGLTAQTIIHPLGGWMKF